MLAVASAPGGFPRLMLALVEANPGTQEILARVRLVAAAVANTHLGGPAFAMNSGSTAGLRLHFQSVTPTDRQLVWQGPNTQAGPGTGFPWQTNFWYWVRVQHQTNTISRYPDLLARVWPADGETQEPAAWTSWWDYCPASPAQKGWPGIAAGVGAPALMEWDFFLVKAEGLPDITVRLPALKAARPRLLALGCRPETGFDLSVAGTSRADYLIEASEDFRTWRRYGVETDSRGQGFFRDTAAPNIPGRFYRARVPD